MRKRVVITGLGTVTALGHSVPEAWNRLLNGESGAGPITHFDASDYPCRIAAEVHDFDPEVVIEAHEARKYDPFTLYGLAASAQAMADSGLEPGTFRPERAGCIMGVGIGGLTDIEATKEKIMARGPRRASPYFIPKIMMNAVSGRVSMKFGLQGPNFVTASACASANHAMGLAMRCIRYGDADVMVTGGSEATITPLGIAGFCSLRALTTRNDDPAGASRPFDKGRDGFLMGEGAGALVLESYEHAKARGARIYAELSGFGMTADAFHITQPAPEGAGAAAAMRLALSDAELDPEDVEYVNAHGTSTPVNDPLETQAIKTVFGHHAAGLAISSTKSMHGHLLGAAGAVEAVISSMVIHTGRVPPTINQDEADPECDLDYVPNEGRELAVRNVLSNSLGFGGHNAVLAFSAV